MYQLLSKYRGQIMGVASIMVVLLHFVVELYPDLHIPGATVILGRGNIGVDIFLLVSGMGLWFSMSKDDNTKRFYLKRIRRVLLPALVITLPYWIWFDLFFQRSGIFRFVLDWTGLSFWTHGVTTTWYVSFIIICYLFYPLIFRLQKKNRSLILWLSLFLIVICSLLAFVMPSIYEKYEIALTRIPVFFIGSYLGEYVLNSKESPSSGKLVLDVYTILSAFVFVASVLVNGRNHLVGTMLYRYGCGGIAILICFVVCWIFDKWKMKPVANIFQYFGKVSLELYLIHVMIRNIVSKSPLGGFTETQQRMVVIVSFVLISIAVTCFVCYLKDMIEYGSRKKKVPVK